ncbi:HAD family hydrolase [Geminicoccus roseus]|uniref:HAD family hydrolase n=1 Tax=Geminicoccus roseus TaxID=404900 RepID=UPI00041B6A09|nr:HAD family hydrolase [Geminicoccus roseus]
MLAGLALWSLAACASGGTATTEVDPLPSWNPTPVKYALVDFVERVITEGDPRYLPPGERIATFDNDGTLWAEQPIYFEVLFALDRVRAMEADHPEWRTEEPYASVIANDPERLARLSQADLVKIIAVTHTGMTEQAFEADTKEWFATARHPTLQKPFPALVYQPQLELLDYLRAHGFETFIVSGGEVDFIRAFAPEAYGIPPEQIMGTTLGYRFQEVDGQPVIDRLPEVMINGDNVGKPVNIHLHIGKKPVLAFGNSDGDLQMLQYADSGDGPRMMLLLHHDDAEREFAYDRQSHVGRLDKAWDEAKKRGWTVVSMKNDFATIFPATPANDD